MEQSRIEQLLNKSVLTEEDKKEITEAADAAGIKYKFRKGCKRCYETALLKLYEACGKKANVSVDGYFLKDTAKAFRVCGILVCNETVKDMKVENLNSNVIARFFEKIETETEENESEV